MNAANEVAVELFLKGHIKFTDIPLVIEDALSHHVQSYNIKLDQVMGIDKDIRLYAYNWPNI